MDYADSEHSFSLVEKCLRDITSTLEANTNDRHYILYSINNNVDSETRKSIFRISAFMLEQIQKIKEEFTPESDKELTVIRDVSSNLSEIWTFKRLRRKDAFMTDYQNVTKNC
ncbi:MAG: hypothetical protein WBZ36_02455 [Candidatus Nitrosopolaris sp.]